MANSINIDQLAAEIAKGLAEYSQDVVEKVNVSSDKVGKGGQTAKANLTEKAWQVCQVLDHDHRKSTRPAGFAHYSC